ncbi:uncharacterized protein METZ01_LOCUS454051, partial [marine metagenome]
MMKKLVAVLLTAYSAVTYGHSGMDAPELM